MIDLNKLKYNWKVIVCVNGFTIGIILGCGINSIINLVLLNQTLKNEIAMHQDIIKVMTYQSATQLIYNYAILQPRERVTVDKLVREAILEKKKASDMISNFNREEL
jgi:hypothetical protein